MIRAFARVGFTAATALTLLMSSVPPADARGLDLQAQGPAALVENWLGEALDWLDRLFSPGEEAPGSPVESATADLGGPTGPCIDPQGSWIESSCR
ncbi:MAG TPA: hypothetical protein VHU81_17470 [Thermoanaerobaculia bacterium]|jgi:hypothetical protein|nr:hypothetical protein [Thermoanaerobaculia bacterium]